MRRQRNALQGISGGVFLIFLALAFSIGHNFFLPLLFIGIALASLFGTISSGKPEAIYGGLQGFAFMIGLASCFLFGFWPWILVVIGVSAILGALTRPIIAGLSSSIAGWQPVQQPYQPPQQPYQSQQQSYQPYQQGYQPPAQPQSQEKYSEGGRQYNYPPQYEQPQAQYPQEMPPQQQ